MSQRDKAETKAAHRHGSATEWASRGHHGDGVNTEHRKAHHHAARKAKRARRRLDKAVIEDELFYDPLAIDEGGWIPIHSPDL